MSRIPHLLLGFVGVGPIVLFDDLVHLEHCVGQGIEVTASTDEDLGLMGSHLNGLEIVREVIGTDDGVGLHLLVEGVVNIEFPGVFLHDVDVQTLHVLDAQAFFLLIRSGDH
jgi:hypothetical protein